MVDQRRTGAPITGNQIEHARRQLISCISSANRSAVSGVNSAGLSTTVFPAASAGATFHASISSGKFHGITWPTTP